MSKATNGNYSEEFTAFHSYESFPFNKYSTEEILGTVEERTKPIILALKLPVY